LPVWAGDRSFLSNFLNYRSCLHDPIVYYLDSPRSAFANKIPGRQATTDNGNPALLAPTCCPVAALDCLRSSAALGRVGLRCRTCRWPPERFPLQRRRQRGSLGDESAQPCNFSMTASVFAGVAKQLTSGISMTANDTRVNIRAAPICLPVAAPEARMSASVRVLPDAPRRARRASQRSKARVRQGRSG
jgi:hypothetical protein